MAIDGSAVDVAATGYHPSITKHVGPEMSHWLKPEEGPENPVAKAVQECHKQHDESHFAIYPNALMTGTRPSGVRLTKGREEGVDGRPVNSSFD